MFCVCVLWDVKQRLEGLGVLWVGCGISSGNFPFLTV